MVPKVFFLGGSLPVARIRLQTFSTTNSNCKCPLLLPAVMGNTNRLPDPPPLCFPPPLTPVQLINRVFKNTYHDQHGQMNPDQFSLPPSPRRFSLHRPCFFCYHPSFPRVCQVANKARRVPPTPWAAFPPGRRQDFRTRLCFGEA